MTYHLEAWQRAVDVALLLVMSIAFGCIVVAIRGPRRGRLTIEQRKRLGTAGGAAFAVALAARLLASDMLKPIARPAPSPAAPIETITDKKFSSTAPPAINIDAPDGFAISFAPDSRHVTLANNSGTLLVIYSRQLDASGTGAGVLARLRQELDSRGVSTTEFLDSIDGKPALGLLATDGASTFATFIVDRGSNYVTVLQCRAPTDARAACRPALSQLHWLPPTR